MATVLSSPEVKGRVALRVWALLSPLAEPFSLLGRSSLPAFHSVLFRVLYLGLTVEPSTSCLAFSPPQSLVASDSVGVTLLYWSMLCLPLKA